MHVAALALAAPVATQVVIALVLLRKVGVPLARLQQQVQQILLQGDGRRKGSQVLLQLILQDRLLTVLPLRQCCGRPAPG